MLEALTSTKMMEQILDCALFMGCVPVLGLVQDVRNIELGLAIHYTKHQTYPRET